MGDKAAAVKPGTGEQRYERWLFSLPKHWRQYTSTSSLRKDLQWFWSLLNAYDAYTQIFLKTISESGWNEKPIPYPKDIEDEGFDNFVLKSYSTGEKQIPAKTTREEFTQLRNESINNCLEKKNSLIKLGEILSGYNRWKEDIKEVCNKNIETTQKLGHVKEENERLRRRIEELSKMQLHSEKMSCQLKKITKEKEDLLIRLSKVAGSKLTTNNPDIADLSDDNRPTKLAEKFGQLYDDAWTDSLEELTEVEAKLDDRMAIRFLLRIVMTAYQFCSGPRSMFLDLRDYQTIMTCTNPEDMKVLIKIPDASKADIQPRTQMRLHAKETISDLQKKFLVILSGVFRDIYRTEKFNSSVSDESETNPWELDEGKAKETSPVNTPFTTNMYNKGIYNTSQGSKEEPGRKSKSARGDFSQPRYETYSKDGFILQREDGLKMLRTPIKSQVESANPETKFAKTTQFAERCVELCWFMQTTHPPIHLSACTPRDGKTNGDIYKAYTKSGTEVDYVVWPAMYLYEKGPLLTKGIAQPK